jgi:hypothetical protein
MEIWKDVIDYEGFYQVSNFGRVKSLNRVVVRSNGKHYTNKERILKISVVKYGYHVVGLTRNGDEIKRTIHQLVAESFLNHRRCGFNLVVNHIDFNPSNNHVSNLEVITHRQNTNKKHIKSSSPYVGVYWIKCRKKWMANILIKGKKTYLGYYDCELKASDAYQNALNKITA